MSKSTAVKEYLTKPNLIRKILPNLFKLIRILFKLISRDKVFRISKTNFLIILIMDRDHTHHDNHIISRDNFIMHNTDSIILSFVLIIKTNIIRLDNIL